MALWFLFAIHVRSSLPHCMLLCNSYFRHLIPRLFDIFQVWIQFFFDRKIAKTILGIALTYFAIHVWRSLSTMVSVCTVQPSKVSMWLHRFTQVFFYHSAIVLCITFHVWKSVDCKFSNKVYRDILRNSYVLTKILTCLCTLYLKNSNLQIFINEKLCMKL